MRLLDKDIPLPSAGPQTWDELLSDCQRCVEPAAEANGEPGASRVLAGAVLAGLWRDVRVDVMEGRGVFIPQDIADRHGLSLTMMTKALRLDEERGCDGSALDGQCNCANMPNTAMRLVLPAYRAAMQELVERTSELLKDPATGKGTLRNTVHEAQATLSLIRRVMYDTLSRQPALGPIARGWMKLRSRFGKGQ